MLRLSFQRFFGLPRLRTPCGRLSLAIFVRRLSSILSTWASHSLLRSFVHHEVLLYLETALNQDFVLTHSRSTPRTFRAKRRAVIDTFTLRVEFVMISANGRAYILHHLQAGPI